ncbi:MAG: hypothetical protein ABI472_23985 [Ginsengibacter sp.]
MKKSTILSAMMVLTGIACAILLKDGLAYLVAALMALTIIGTVNSNRSGVMKMTRWAKANPKKAQVLITMLQLALAVLGIFAGNNLKELGFEFSDTTAYIFGTIAIIGFLSVPFLPKRRAIAIPRVVNRHRSAYIGIALSSFVMMVVFGNRIANDYPNSSITHAVKAIDTAIFPDNNTPANPDDEALKPEDERNYEQALADGSPGNFAVFAVYTIPDKETITSSSLSKKEARETLKAEKKAYRLEKRKKRMMNLLIKHRLAVEAGTAILGVFLIILLVGSTCAGLCLMLGAFGDAGVGSILLGAVITAGSVWGIIATGRMLRRKNKTEP